MSQEKRENRKAVSLRIPRQAAEMIEEYADLHGVRKTDAYLHFIDEGIRASLGPTTDMALLLGKIEALERKIDALASQPEQLARTKDRPLQKEEVACVVADICEAYPAVRAAWLFGSYARNKQTTESDIDLRIDIDPAARFTLHDLAAFAKSVEQETGKECDIVSARKIKNKSLAEAIERDKVLIYER